MELRYTALKVYSRAHKQSRFPGSPAFTADEHFQGRMFPPYEPVVRLK